MKQGYVLIHAPDHPYAGKSSRKVMEHRLVVEAHLRVTEPDSPFLVEINGVKYLRRDVEVHHRNEVKGDNRIENLHPMTKAEHARHHESFADVVKQRQVDRQIWDAGVASQAHLCRCGCGKAIDVRPHHYHQGIPAFIPGHNRRKR